MTAQKHDGFMTLSALEEDLVTVLQGKELYGLQVMNAMNDASQGKRQVGFGSLYPTLHKLEKKGLIKARWGDESDPNTGGARRKYYKMTGLGEQVLRETQIYRTRLAQWEPAF